MKELPSEHSLILVIDGVTAIFPNVRLVPVEKEAKTPNKADSPVKICSMPECDRRVAPNHEYYCCDPCMKNLGLGSVVRSHDKVCDYYQVYGVPGRSGGEFYKHMTESVPKITMRAKGLKCAKGCGRLAVGPAANRSSICCGGCYFSGPGIHTSSCDMITRLYDQVTELQESLNKMVERRREVADRLHQFIVEELSYKDRYGLSITLRNLEEKLRTQDWD